MTVYTYGEHRACLLACREAGLSLGETLDALDARLFANERDAGKMRRVGARDHYGTEVVQMPHFGGYHDIPMALAVANNRMILQYYVRKEFTPETVVLEVGSAAGDIIVPLARDYGRPGMRFIGTELNQDGLDCINILAEIGKAPVETRLFDVRAPAFSFLPEGTPVVIVVNAVLSYFDKATVQNFFETLLNTRCDFVLCIFEILSTQIGGIVPNHKPLAAVQGWSANPAVLQALAALQGRLKATLTPDVSGKGAWYPLSYLRVTRT